MPNQLPKLSDVEAEGYKFGQSVRFIETAAAATGTRTLFDVGAWYGVLAEQLFARTPALFDCYIMVEAVVEIAQGLMQKYPMAAVLNTTVCPKDKYRPYFNIEVANSLHTSGIDTPETEATQQVPVGPWTSPLLFVERNKLVFPSAGVKLNIEGNDLFVVRQMILQSALPKFLLMEVFGRLSSDFDNHMWSQLRDHYRIPLTDSPIKGHRRVAHIGFYEGYCCWWYPGGDEKYQFVSL